MAKTDIVFTSNAFGSLIKNNEAGVDSSKITIERKMWHARKEALPISPELHHEVHHYP